MDRLSSELMKVAKEIAADEAVYSSSYENAIAQKLLESPSFKWLMEMEISEIYALALAKAALGQQSGPEAAQEALRHEWKGALKEAKAIAKELMSGGEV